MALFLSAVGSNPAPAANELRTLAVFKESSCERFCATTDVQPQVFVTYKAGTPRLVDTTVFVPVTATVTVVAKTGCCKAQPFVFTENFLAAFQGQTALPTAVTITSLGQEATFPNGCCGRTRCITVNDSLLITITPAAAPAA